MPTVARCSSFSRSTKQAFSLTFEQPIVLAERYELLKLRTLSWRFGYAKPKQLSVENLSRHQDRSVARLNRMWRSDDTRTNSLWSHLRHGERLEWRGNSKRHGHHNQSGHESGAHSRHRR